MTETFTENVSCPICGEDKFTVLKESGYPADLSRDRMVEVFKSSSDTKLFDQLVSCSDCNLVYLNPRIRSDIIIDSYAGGHDPRFAAQMPCASGPSANVLEIGCNASELQHPLTVRHSTSGAQPVPSQRRLMSWAYRW